MFGAVFLFLMFFFSYLNCNVSKKTHSPYICSMVFVLSLCVLFVCCFDCFYSVGTGLKLSCALILRWRCFSVWVSWFERRRPTSAWSSTYFCDMTFYSINFNYSHCINQILRPVQQTILWFWVFSNFVSSSWKVFCRCRDVQVSVPRFFAIASSQNMRPFPYLVFLFYLADQDVGRRRRCCIIYMPWPPPPTGTDFIKFPGWCYHGSRHTSSLILICSITSCQISNLFDAVPAESHQPHIIVCFVHDA